MRIENVVRIRWGDKITSDLRLGVRGQTAHWRWEHDRRSE